jgi:hypothetical protein
LASLLLPVLSKAKSKAHYARWLGYQSDMRKHSNMIAYYNGMNAENDTVVENAAVGPEDNTYYNPENYNGGMAGGAYWTTGRWSAKNAMGFMGASQFVNLGKVDVSYKGQDADEMSIVCWFKANDFGISDARLVSKAEGAATDQHVFMLSTISSSGIKLRARIRLDGTTTTVIASSGDIEAFQWYQAAMTYNGSVLKLYLNGQEVGSQALTGSISRDNTMYTFIGDNPNGTGAPISNNQTFDGLIDEVGIFNKALSAQEVLDHYEMGLP